MDHKIKLILASASPRRREILEGLGFQFEISAADIDEGALCGEDPVCYAKRVARLKADFIFHKYKKKIGGSFILAADTVVDKKGAILCKPNTCDEAKLMISQLQGTSHFVHTAVVLITPTGDCLSGVETTRVFFESLREAEVDAYLRSDEWRDKAGGYGIQGLAKLFVKKIEGCFYNVVGLPAHLCSVLLTQGGYNLVRQMEEYYGQNI